MMEHQVTGLTTSPRRRQEIQSAAALRPPSGATSHAILARSCSGEIEGFIMKSKGVGSGTASADVTRTPESGLAPPERSLGGTPTRGVVEIDVFYRQLLDPQLRGTYRRRSAAVSRILRARSVTWLEPGQHGRIQPKTVVILTKISVGSFFWQRGATTPRGECVRGEKLQAALVSPRRWFLELLSCDDIISPRYPDTSKFLGVRPQDRKRV